MRRNTQDQRLATADETTPQTVSRVRCIRWFYCEHNGVNNMAYVPPMKPIPKNADAETRRRMYWEYVDLCVELNPGSFLPVGVKKKWWHLLKIEHPETSRGRSDA